MNPEKSRSLGKSPRPGLSQMQKLPQVEAHAALWPGARRSLAKPGHLRFETSRHPRGAQGHGCAPERATATHNVRALRRCSAFSTAGSSQVCRLPLARRRRGQAGNWRLNYFKLGNTARSLISTNLGMQMPASGPGNSPKSDFANVLASKA